MIASDPDWETGAATFRRRRPRAALTSLGIVVVAAQAGGHFAQPPTSSRPAGQVREFPLPGANRLPTGIAAGPDGALWFTEREGERIGRITSDGHVREAPLPTANSTSVDFPGGITTGPHVTLWFTESAGDRVGHITPAG